MKFHGVEISLGARQEEEPSNERAQDNRWEEQHSFSFVEATIEVGMGILMSRWSDGRALEELLCPHSDNHRCSVSSTPATEEGSVPSADEYSRTTEY